MVDNSGLRLTLIYFTTRTNVFLNLLIWENFLKKMHFRKLLNRKS